MQIKSTLVHGDDEVASYQHFSKLIELLKSQNYLVVDISDSSQYSPRQSLFSELVAYQMQVSSETSLKVFLEYVQKGNLVLGLSQKNLSAPELAKVDPKQVQVVAFKLGKDIWRFLDGFYPNNTHLLTMYQSLIQKESPDMIFAMLCRQLALLNVAKLGFLAGLVSGWQKQKLQSQASKFEKRHLKSLAQRALTLDLQVKKGILDIETAVGRLLIALNSYES